MKYVLSKGLVLRREWFGCLGYQTYSGRFWQLNQDAFEILRHLKEPKTIDNLRLILNNNDLDIARSDLEIFIKIYKEQGLIDVGEKASEVLLVNEDFVSSRTDCLSIPSSVTIYITDFCTKCCRHCATDSHMRIKRSDELKLEDWKKILVKLRRAGVLVLVFSGGEPLAIPETEQLLKIADEMQFGLSLLTDYDEITETQIANLKSLKHPINIQTSLDGSTTKTHDFLRGKGSFLKTKRRLKMLQSANMVYTVSVAVHKNNFSELEEIADFAYDHGASYIYLNAVAPYGRAKETMKDLLLNENELKQMAQLCLRWTAGDRIKLRNPFWEEHLDHLGDKNFHPFKETLNAMSLGVYNFTINSQGRCYLDAKQRAEDFLFLGDIVKDDLISMWNNPKLDVLRTMKQKEEFTYANQTKIEAALASI